MIIAAMGCRQPADSLCMCIILSHMTNRLNLLLYRKKKKKKGILNLMLKNKCVDFL